MADRQFIGHAGTGQCEEVYEQKLTKEEREDVARELHTTQQCRWSVALQIAEGITCPTFVPLLHPTPIAAAYIAGPMRGYPQFNFPAFDQAVKDLTAAGVWVISPADIDRAAGVTETTSEVETQAPKMVRQFVYRDFHAIFSLRPETGDFLCVLPGWEASTGACAEVFLARWLKLPIRDQHLQAITSYDVVNLDESIKNFLLWSCEQDV